LKSYAHIVSDLMGAAQLFLICGYAPRCKADP